MEEKAIGPETNEIWCAGEFGHHGHKTFWRTDDPKWTDDGKWVCIDCQRAEYNFDHSDRVGTRPWGKYFVLDEDTGYKVKRIEVLPGKRLSLQSHGQRSESWTAVSGSGKFLVGDQTTSAHPGAMVYVGLDQKHRMINDGPDLMVVIEVQMGSVLMEDDIVRYEDDFGRVDGDGSA